MAVPDRAAIKEMMQRWRRTTDLVRKVGTAAAEQHERAGHRGKRARNGRTLGRVAPSRAEAAAADPIPRRGQRRSPRGSDHRHDRDRHRPASALGAPRLDGRGDGRHVATQPCPDVRAKRPASEQGSGALCLRDGNCGRNQLRRVRDPRGRGVEILAASRSARRRRCRRAAFLQWSPNILVRALPDGARVRSSEAQSKGRATMSVDAEVLVIGAGPAGLTAAYCLTKETRSVLVIEKDPAHVGGISRTVRYKDYLFDVGGHRFFSKSQEVVDLWHEILPGDFITRPRLSRIYYDGKFYSYPLKAFEALKNLGVVQSAPCMLSYACAKALPIPEPRSFHQWVRNQFGERLFSIFFKTYTEKVWGMSCDEISADWAAQRIKGLNLGAAVIDGLRRSLGRKKASRSGEVTKTLIESFRYPRKGPGMMWEAAAQKIREFGGDV